MFILKNQFDWLKRDIFILIIINVSVGLIFNFYRFNYLLESITIAALGFKALAFGRYASIMPSVNADFDRFSWKYFQGLPINKRELICALAMSRLLTTIPFLFWVSSFYFKVAEVFYDKGDLTIFSLVKLISFLIPVILITGFNSIVRVINFPRAQFQRKNAKELFYLSTRNLLVGATIILYIYLIYIFMDRIYDFRLKQYLKLFDTFIEYFITSWWLHLSLVFGVWATMNYALKLWKNEKISYKRAQWSPRRDIGLSLASLVLIAFPLRFIDFKTPSAFQGDRIFKLVYRNDQSGLKSYIESNGERVLSMRNKYGFTPLLVAAHEGNLEVYKILRAYGAKYNGEKISMKDSYYNGMNISFLSVIGRNSDLLNLVLKEWGNPKDTLAASGDNLLHVASSFCHTEMVDSLIKYGVALNKKNNKGSTPSHIIARQRHCFGPLVALYEAGADIEVEDSKGKRPIDLASKKGNRESIYFLEKHSRSPASR